MLYNEYTSNPSCAGRRIAPISPASFIWQDLRPQIQLRPWPPSFSSQPESSLLSSFVIKLVSQPCSDSKLAPASFLHLKLCPPPPRCQLILLVGLLLRQASLSGYIVLLNLVVEALLVLVLKPQMPLQKLKLAVEVGMIVVAIQTIH